MIIYMVKCLAITSYTIIISCDVFLYHVHTFEVRMHFKRLTSHNDSMYKAAIKFYADSFPIYEQRRSESQIKILQDNEYKFDLICDSDQWLGIICFLEFNQFIYIEHFAINAQLRNKQYGQRTLQLLRKEYEKVNRRYSRKYEGYDLRVRNFNFLYSKGYSSSLIVPKS